MSNNPGRVNRPYRKASEYLVNSQHPPAPTGMRSQLEQENDSLRQKVLVLTRKLERSEAEFMQSREYLENQLDLSHDREIKINDQYKKLQTSYVGLQSTNRELEAKVLKINRLEVEKNSMVKEINELTNKVTESRNALFKAQEENERLRKDCNLAVQLLKCNQSNYQVQRPEQLPDDIQERVSSYKVELQDYNEYINPYADGCSDSESDDGNVQHNKSTNSNKHPQTGQAPGNSVPIEFLAEALKKPENVHMNLEASDFIRDPALHSIYKAHYTERKLIKPDYGQEQSGGSERNHDTQDDGIKESSPWELAPDKQISSQEESSPWELAPSRRGVARYQNDEEEEDGSSAGAYGAYSVGTKRRPYKPQTEIHSDANRPSRVKMRETSLGSDGSSNTRTASPSPERLQFRQPTMPPPKTGISSYFSRSTKSSPSITSSSTSSSKKSTPYKVCDKESATNAEKSSLLNEPDSDEELQIEVTHYPSSKHSSPDKSYLKREKNIGDQGGGLLDPDDDEERLAPTCGEIDLEWEPEIPHQDDMSYVVENPPEVEDLSLGGVEENLTVEPHSDLLLSYNDAEALQRMTLDDLLDYNNSESNLIGIEDGDGLLGMSNQRYLPPPNHSAQLLSEIITNNPSLESFLFTQPPPPDEFASPDEAVLSSGAANPQYHTDMLQQDVTVMSGGALSHPEAEYSHDIPESTRCEDEAIIPENYTKPGSSPSRVDEQVEVIDLDEEPRKRINRRRNSFDQAQEFGNIMNV